MEISNEYIDYEFSSTDMEFFDGTLDYNLTIEPDEITHVSYYHRPEAYIVPVVFFIIFILGVLGNGMLITIFLRDKTMRNVPNSYIFSLALGDLLAILTCVPLVSIIYTLEWWPWGTVMCKVSYVSEYISIGVSAFTLMVFSAECYYTIVNPLRQLQTKPKTVSIRYIGMIWLLAILLALPYAYYSNVEKFLINPNETLSVCMALAEMHSYRIYRFALEALIYYIIPFCIMVCFCVLMAIRLYKNSNDLEEAKSTQIEAEVKAERETALMVVILVFLFFICFLPLLVFMSWFHSDPNSIVEYGGDWWHATNIIGFCTRFLHLCVNPVVLYCMGGVFRVHFNRYLCCRCRKTQRMPQQQQFLQ